MSGVPAAGPLPVVSLPDVAETTTRHGVRVVAVRRHNVPLVQLRLHLPLGPVRTSDTAVLRLLQKMFLAGTGTRSGSEVASTLQRLGLLVGAGADVDDVSVSAGVPAGVLEEGLGELVDIVAHPSFPGREVAGERERVVQEVLQEAVDPTAIATHAFTARLFGRHPYADPLPEPGTVRRTGRARLVRFHAERLRPEGSVLVAVGDVQPERVVALVEAAFERWEVAGGAAAAALEEPAATARDDRIIVVDRPGAVQSNLRVGARCATRHDPEFPALFLASTVLGGYFTSRLVDNLRERHGYTYSPRAGLEERRLATTFAVKAEVGTEVTAPALAETRYELARMATTEASDGELDAARRYVTGMIAMAAATQAGLAGMLGSLVVQGLDPSYLERFTRELGALDAGAVRRAAGRHLGPAAMTTVVVGDAARVADELRPLGEVAVVA